MSELKPTDFSSFKGWPVPSLRGFALVGALGYFFYHFGLWVQNNLW